MKENSASKTRATRAASFMPVYNILSLYTDPGEEEEQYWHKVLDGSGGREKSGGGGRRGGRGRGRGRGGGYNRKRKERLSVSETDSQPPESKSQKTVED